MNKIPLSSPDISELEVEAVTRVVRSGSLSLGPEMRQFEAEFAHYSGSRFAVSVSSGTAGLHCVVQGLGIGEGDEVITSPFSFIASSNCILFERATPVFVDIDPDTLCLDAAKIEERITPKTKAILPVHLIGISCDMTQIQALAKKYNLQVIEDACEAMGTSWEDKKVGAFGDAGVFAFYPNKQMTTAEGGMIITDNEQLAEFCRSVRNQGRSAHDSYLFERLGFNYRMSNIHAALGRVQLSRIDEILKKRRQVAQWYIEDLEKVEDITLPPGSYSDSTSWFIFLIRLSDAFNSQDRAELQKKLLNQGIETGAYFPTIHLQPFYRKMFGFKPGDFPITENISSRTLALPFFTQMTREQVGRATQVLIENLSRLNLSRT